MSPRVARALRSPWWLFALSALAVAALLATSRSLPSTRSTELSAVTGAIDVARPAQVLEPSLHSASLGRDMPYTVFLPPGYSAGQRYPVLYMLHGIGGDHATEWPGYGLLDEAAMLMAAGDVRPFIIVLPEGEDGYWVDHVDGPAWGSYLA